MGGSQKQTGSGLYSGGLTWSTVLRCDDHTGIFTLLLVVQPSVYSAWSAIAALHLCLTYLHSN